MSIKRICCVGAGYVGGPTMAVIADRCPEIQVDVVDLNKKRIEAWNDPDLTQLPIYEPGLDEIVGRTRHRNLHFSTEVEKKISEADMVFLSVNTPTKKKGIGAGQASDLRWIEACTRQVASSAKGHTIVVEKSTLPVRTAETIQTILAASNEGDKTFSVLSNPEFLAEGTAISDLLEPDRVLIGGSDKSAVEALTAIYEHWVASEKVIQTNLWSSELSKLTANAFLAQRVSSINSISALCETTGADIKEVRQAIGSDERLGNKFLSSGPGFGGSCFKKDILNLVYLCRNYGLDEVGDYWEQVVKLNSWQQERIARLVVNKLFNTVAGKKIAILGFAFKENTNDTRESPAIHIARELLEEGARLAIHDPKVDPHQIGVDLGIQEGAGDGDWHFAKSPMEACKQSDACLLLTAWNEYRELNWEQIATVMRRPGWVFDARSVCNEQAAKQAGLNVWRVGQG